MLIATTKYLKQFDMEMNPTNAFKNFKVYYIILYYIILYYIILYYIILYYIILRA